MAGTLANLLACSLFRHTFTLLMRVHHVADTDVQTLLLGYKRQHL